MINYIGLHYISLIITGPCGARWYDLPINSQLMRAGIRQFVLIGGTDIN